VIKVDRPIFGFGKETNDYGQGFYCSEDLSLAKELACLEDETDAFINPKPILFFPFL
jgi:hypothetical protein